MQKFSNYTNLFKLVQKQLSQANLLKGKSTLTPDEFNNHKSRKFMMNLRKQRKINKRRRFK